MDEMTIGEIQRSLGRLELSQHEQTKKLNEIRDQTIKTNGYVGRHEERLNGIDREVRDLKQGRTAHHDLTRATDTTDAITVSIPTNKKALTMMLAATGSIVAATITAIVKFMGWL